MVSPSAINSPNKVCLIIIDGWGVSSASSSCLVGDAIHNANTPNMDQLKREFYYTELEAHGLSVGLPDRLMGNSEVGHLNIGAGRIVYQDIVRIEKGIKEGWMENGEALQDAFLAAKQTGVIHFVGLVSDGGVHSHISHLKTLLTCAKNAKIENAIIHVITDGRDTAPTSAINYIKDLISFMEGDLGNYGRIGTVVGRYYAMDRDKRWERTRLALDAFCYGKGQAVANYHELISLIKQKYEGADVERDEFLKPIIIDNEARINLNDSVIFFNFRSDRMRQIVSAINEEYQNNLKITCMTRYNADFPFPVISPPQKLDNVLAEYLSRLGIAQFHTAETEKYAHVTFFFNGGQERQFPGEERRLIPSPKVSTYDLKPEMSVAEVALSMIEAIQSGKYPFIMGNFAPPDMVGHTGKYDPTIRAVEATDEAIGKVWDACRDAGVTLVITADHGNAEKMKSDVDGGDHTAHTCAKVPLIITKKDITSKQSTAQPALCNVAPTVLQLMGLSIPSEMTAESLLQ